VRFGLSLPGYGDGVDAAVVADWAVDAERAGRDGFFLWDHLFAFGSGPIPVVDPRIRMRPPPGAPVDAHDQGAPRRHSFSHLVLEVTGRTERE
jgi:hypothetical protein